ncbi:xanthine dehydrogenase-like [Cylas formicarius]|uniref:xanthine dehydrogenase-like n=1 Tax=Cylas formicarius TaxID=197179 RepID=UPI002958BFBC|nr:xanthine dehydrogenase-like [Cylas formicarius]
MKLESEIRFHVSGQEFAVKSSDVTPQTTLNTYLRDILHLTGTKKMCVEGGCGVCIVAVEELQADGTKKIFAVNSCLVSIYSCHGWKIITTEGIGNPIIGYHKIQKLLAVNNGSQCGFCSTGMVMNMYAYHESGPRTQQDIENAFGGNICRCTGYRPILTAFKQLAIDADGKRNQFEVIDIEDVKKCKISECKRCYKSPIYFELGANSQWMKVYYVKDLLQVLRTIGNKTYQLVCGNTARGVYWQQEDEIPDVYIDVSGVRELAGYSADTDTLVLGGNFTLTNTIDLFLNLSRTNMRFRHLRRMAEHIDLVAHVPVRNIGSLAGNLMTKHLHNEFPSDIFLTLETVNATLVILDAEENEIRATPAEFLNLDMNKKIIREIVLVGYDESYYYQSYKIMPRAQNAHAQVNAGFLFRLNGQYVVQSARIVFGAINPQFIHASATERFLQGQVLFDNTVLQRAYQSLENEINPDWVQPDPSPPFRRLLAISLFYKCILSIAPDNLLSARHKTGGQEIFRPVSSAFQTINSDQSLYPLTQPVTKVEALAQTSGQAQYILDIPDQPGQLHAVLVQARATPGSTITKIDTTAALKVSGMVAFFSAKDIPGINSIKVPAIVQMVYDEELFCSGRVIHYHQPVGVIVAETHDLALLGAGLVRVEVSPPPQGSTPLISISDVLKNNRRDRIRHQTSVVARSTGKDIKTTVTGQVNLLGQYHYHMETQNCQVIPTEDGFDVYAGTQWMDHIQGVIAQVLNIPSQTISVFVKRLGGAFGAKITRNGFISGAAALAASKLRRPVRLWMSFSSNMDIIGKRFPFLCDYTVAVNAAGVIQTMKADLYSDYSTGGNEPVDNLVVEMFQNVYKIDTWNYDTYIVGTDTAANCYMRAPGTLEAIAGIESIMDHIALQLNLDPLDVRLANLDAQNNPIIVQFLNDVRNRDNVDARKREIAKFNAANRWRKKAISVVPMRWIVEVQALYTTYVSIYHLDGGVTVSHGGIEMGQGINTKVAQVAAYKFGIPIEKVTVKPSYNLISPNSYSSGASLTSEAVVFSLLKACDILLERIQPTRQLNPNATWEQLIQLCYTGNVNLSTNGFYSGNEPSIQEYPVYGVCVLELEVDLLSGLHQINNVDILEDVGQSMSPLIDIGQLEGAFVMGIGYHSTEELKMDSDGRVTTDRTWYYKVPGFRDIPVNFNVRFSSNTPNPVGVLKSKAIAEPPTCLAISVQLAIRSALASARREANPGLPVWFNVDGPSTVEKILLNSLNNYKQYTL